MRSKSAWARVLAFAAVLAAAPAGAQYTGGRLLTLPDGRTLMAAEVTHWRGTYRAYGWGVARFNPDGTPDSTFNGGGYVAAPIWYYYEHVIALGVQADGRVLLGGNVADPVGFDDDECYPAWCLVRPALVRLAPDGSLDRTFNGTGKLVLDIGELGWNKDVPENAYLERFEVAADGRITLWSRTGAMARVTADGAVDGTFATQPAAGAFERQVAVMWEVYNAALDHYFYTWVAEENLALDGALRGWAYTGAGFKALLGPNGAAATSPVCRFYLPPAFGDSHFFGRGAEECEATARQHPEFVLEDARFIHAVLPVNGMCRADTRPVYRVFSNRADANHRYTTDKAVRDAMVAKGWLPEGDGPDAVTLCAPR